MKKGPSKFTRNSEKTTRRRRKHDEEFKQQALAMVRNGQNPRSVAELLVKIGLRYGRAETKTRRTNR